MAGSDRHQGAQSEDWKDDKDEGRFKKESSGSLGDGKVFGYGFRGGLEGGGQGGVDEEVPPVDGSPGGWGLTPPDRTLKEAFWSRLTQEDLFGYYGRPWDFVMDMFPWGFGQLKGKMPRGWQRDYLLQLGDEIRSRRYVGKGSVMPIKFSTASGHGTGKTTLSAWIILFLHHTRMNSVGTVTAVIADQLKNRTWRELGKWYDMSPALQRFSDYHSSSHNMSYRCRMSPDQWFALGKTVESHRAEAFAGQHSEGSSSWYLIDEASGVPDEIYEVAKWGAMGSEGHFHVFGNGTRPSGFFFRSHHSESSEWIRRKIDASVVFPDNEFIKAEIKLHGWDSDIVRVRIRGEFPSSSSNQFLPYDFLDECFRCSGNYLTSDPVVYGVDVGSVGPDRSVIFPVKGNMGEPEGHAVEILHYPNQVDLINHLANRIRVQRPDYVVIDQGGPGIGVVQHLQRRNFRGVEGVNFAWASPDETCANMRTYMYWRLKERIMTGQFKLPDIQGLRDELGALTFKQRHSDDRIQLDSKDEIKKALGRSPDVADALALTQALDVEPAALGSNTEYEQYDFMR